MDQENSLYLRYAYLSGKKGMDSDQVRESLIHEGWTDTQIDDLITANSNKNQSDTPKTTNQSDDSLLNLRLRNGKLFLKLLAVILVGTGAIFIWQGKTANSTNYQSVFINYLKAVEKKDLSQAASYESLSEKQLLGTNHAIYNSCNMDAQACNQAIISTSLLRQPVKTLNYSSDNGAKGEEQIFQENLAGCDGGKVNIEVTTLPIGNTWKINSINIVKLPQANSCPSNASTGSQAISNQASTAPLKTANRPTDSEAAVHRSNTPPAATNGNDTTSLNLDGILHSLPVSLGQSKQ